MFLGCYKTITSCYELFEKSIMTGIQLTYANGI